MAEVLSVRGVSRAFGTGGGRLEVVREASFDVAEGELVVLLGRSGAGKSTLLALIGGLDRPDSGSIRVGNQEVTALESAPLEHYLRQTVAWVFQSSGLMPLLSAEENVWLGLRIAGTNSVEARRQASAALEAVGLSGRASHRALELSGGEQQRVALARALARSPLLLLADEPTAQLDSETSRSVLELIREAAASGTSVLLATHDRAAAEFADRVLLMEDGRVREAVVAG